MFYEPYEPGALVPRHGCYGTLSHRISADVPRLHMAPVVCMTKRVVDVVRSSSPFLFKRSPQALFTVVLRAEHLRPRLPLPTDLTSSARLLPAAYTLPPHFIHPPLPDTATMRHAIYALPTLHATLPLRALYLHCPPGTPLPHHAPPSPLHLPTLLLFAVGALAGVATGMPTAGDGLRL